MGRTHSMTISKNHRDSANALGKTLPLQIVPLFLGKWNNHTLKKLNQ
jgi:hypothetical protein